MLVEYIKKHTHNNNEWITIKHREVPNICNTSQYYVPRIFEGVQEHPNIAFKKNIKATTYNKPLIFKYIDKEEKFDVLKDTLEYDYISIEQIEKLYSVLNIDDYLLFIDYLNLINYLKYLEEDDTAVIDEEYLSQIYLKPIEEIKVMINKLKEKDILKITDEQEFKIKLPTTQQKNSVVNLPQSTLILTEKKQKNSIEEKEQCIEEKEQHHTIDDLVSSIGNFQDMMISFQKYLEKQSDILVDKALTDLDKHEEQQQEVEKIQETMNKLIEENELLKENNEKNKKENELLYRSLEKAEKHKDLFVQYAQQKLEIMVAEISNLLSDYIQIPHWQKDEGINAKLQRNILNTITNAVNAILEHNNE